MTEDNLIMYTASGTLPLLPLKKHLNLLKSTLLFSDSHLSALLHLLHISYVSLSSSIFFFLSTPLSDL